ncbi:MAG: Tol-Pal system beta propeller repeat protein TolB [Nitrospirae bacterium]|nr:Tol-Pal system beta propeller repeat protein TolB [Nitrospirota bacterium]
MTNKFKVQSSKFKAYIIFLLFLLFTFNPLSTLFNKWEIRTFDVEAKVYIDINSPAFKKLPVAIQDFSGASGKEIAEIIRNDLDFTGLFELIDKSAYIENPSQPFNPANWTPIGVETVIKGSIQEVKDLIVTVTLNDVFEGKEIMRKKYTASRDLLIPLAHTISNDIYYMLTGEQGIFRSRIAFIEDTKKEKQLCIMDWDGNRIIKTGIKGNIILSPHWSPNGDRLIYAAERNRHWSIYLLDFTNMIEKKIFSSKGTNIAGDFFPSGNEIAFSSSKDGTPDLYIMNLKNSDIVKLTSSYGIDVSPAISPDGNYIAFVSDRGGTPQIYTMKKDGSNLRRITFEGSYNTSPSWSPKGDKIVFTGRRGLNQIFIVNPDGTGLTQLTANGNNEEPSFSPDGRYITFTSDRDKIKGVYIMRANGEFQKRISPENLKAYNSRWSQNYIF